MYDDDVDFHVLSGQKQNRLVHNKQVATTGELLSEVPDETVPVRVFEKSLEELILDELETGQFSVNELAEIFGVRASDVRQIMHKLRRRSQDDFTAENTKFNLITDRQGIVRAKETDGPEHYYTLEKIPFFARVVDPTLGFSLLELKKRVADFPRVVDYIPGGKATELDEDYALVVGGYWGIDPEEVFDYLTEFDREYVETSLIPLPIVDADEQYHAVADRFVQSEGVYKRFRIDRNRIEELTEMFERQIERGDPGVGVYQASVIDIADLRWYARQERPDLLRTVDNWIDRLVTALEPTESEEEQEGRNQPGPEIALEDQFQVVMDSEPRTLEEIYQSLNPIVQAETSVTELEKKLDHYAKVGIISHQSVDGTSKYSLG